MVLTAMKSVPLSPPRCDELRRTLERLGCARVVVGHTPQRGINAACDGLVWRCDTGMSRHVMAGRAEALEISPDGVVRVLGEPVDDAQGAAAASVAPPAARDWMDLI